MLSSSGTSSVACTYVPYKYITTGWRHSPLLRKDPLALAFLKTLLDEQTIFTILKGKVVLYLSTAAGAAAAAKGKGKHPAAVPQLYLPSAQVPLFIAALAETQGPTRAAQSWKKDLDVVFRDAELQRIECATVEELREVVERVRRENDQGETEPWSHELRRVKERFARRKGKWIAIDVETWEHDHGVITEVGWSFLSWDSDGQRVRKDRHHYSFGTSSITSEAKLSDKLLAMLKPTATTPVYLIFHDPRSDLVALDLLGLPTSSYTRSLPPIASPYIVTNEKPTVTILDTQTLFSGLLREKRKYRLELVCEKLGIKVGEEAQGDLKGAGWHNAGNDARFTLEVFLKMMESEPVKTE
ncbi:ribonuclease H-like domain containing protein [Pseudohyphozyma bogoriensis]|nr:ribonuclease H-like domain containing protein [Pseudohyphozyma bogoriensis]